MPLPRDGCRDARRSQTPRQATVPMEDSGKKPES